MLGHAKASMTLDVYADLFDTDLDAVVVELDAAIRAANIQSRVIGTAKRRRCWVTGDGGAFLWIYQRQNVPAADLLRDSCAIPGNGDRP
jgi:hypothetical protein